MGMEDILRILEHPDSIPELKLAYARYLCHCFIDTELEAKEANYWSNLWKIFSCFIEDVGSRVG
jgi:inositol 1,4,5-triphosphate receptor type 1